LRILYGVSPIGLGHATRAVAVGEQLKGRGVEFLFATGGPAAAFISDYGFDVEEVVTEPVPRVVSGEMKDAALWYLRYWIGYRRSGRKMGELITRERPDLIVGDEEFSGLEIARARGTRHIMITDELELGFAKGWFASRIEARVDNWYKALIRNVDMLVVPEEGVDERNIRHVGPIARRATKSRAATRSELSLSEGRSLILLSLSGAGIGGNLVAPTIEAARREDVELVITGNRRERVRGDRIHDLGLVRENQNLIAAADLVISTAGKSTIDEALSFGTPIIAIPTKNHAEQERNALALGYAPSDVGRLTELIPEKLGRRTEPRASDGARKTAELMLTVF
jgi:UDP-N-acetylglucosamine--N-acetylmuramyl-(pentapeptide) pyrophosphoryl-undecaprenol N-acetylglucosamine transferase